MSSSKEQMTAARRRFRSKQPNFLCPLPLRNRLPEPLPGPKLVQLPTDLWSHIDFKPTTLDTEYKWKHHCECTLGVHVDLVDLEAHTPAKPELRPALHPDDERLLNWDAHVKAQAAGAGDRVGTRPGEITWMKKTSFMSNDLTSSVHMFKSGTQIKAEEHERIVEQDKAQGNDSQSLLVAAENSFLVHDDDVANLRHPTKPTVTAEWSVPVLPDARLWANDFVHVGFEDDPAPNNPRKRARVARSMIVNAKPVFNEKQQKTVVKGVFVLPAEEQPDEDRTALEWERQYQVETKDADNSYVFFIDETSGSCTYVEHTSSKVELRSGLSTRVARQESDGKFTVQRCEIPPDLAQERAAAVQILAEEGDGDGAADPMEHSGGAGSDSQEGMSSSDEEPVPAAQAMEHDEEAEEEEAEEGAAAAAVEEEEEP